MNSKVTFTRFLALMLLVVMTLSMVSCDMINSITGNHTHSYVDGKCKECGETDPNYSHEHYFVNDKCIYCGENKPVHEHNFVDGKCECGQELIVPPELKTITIAEALEIATANPDGTEANYYINATIKTLKNPSNGEMTIEDETGEIYVYGVRGTDWKTYFGDLPERPVKGDKVTLLCRLGQYKGTNQVNLAALIDFDHVEVDVSDLTNYQEMTIAEARDAEEGTLIKVSGVVARITYANKQIPSGVILVDGTSSIYVHDGDLAGQVSIGNTVEIAASKAYWILADEINNANKYGYKGSNQLENVIVISNDKGNTDFDKSWITDSTVKEMMDTPVTEDITSKIFKVTALVKKAPNTGFTNYYIYDIDGETGSYVYTQCNGNDFGWLDEFDNKICTVYLVALNAKSTNSGCVWRFVPVAVSDDGYTFNLDDAAEFAVKYHGVTSFHSQYMGDPMLDIPTSVSSELLGFEGATLSYSSSDEEVVYFTEHDGLVNYIQLHGGKAGTAVITVTGTYNGKSYSEQVTVTISENQEIDYITVADAIATPAGTNTVVKGIVGPSLVNQTGFYLIDETGAIAVRVSSETMATLKIGYEVIMTGTRTISKDGGQICIDNATVTSNNYGNHSYSTNSFIKDKTILEICKIPDSVEATTAVYVTTAKIYVDESQYSVTIQLKDPNGSSTSYLLLYSGGKDQYSWLKAYNNKVITVEVAICDWNSKGLKGCVLAVVNDDGTKIVNSLNFS